MPTSKDDANEAVRVLLGEYREFLSDKAEGTVEAYLRTVRHLIGWMARLPGNKGRFESQQLTQSAIEQYLAHLEQEGLSLSHRTRVKSTISNFAQFLIEEKGLLQRNPTRSIALPPVTLLASQLLSGEQRSILQVLVEQADNRRGLPFSR